MAVFPLSGMGMPCARRIMSASAVMSQLQCARRVATVFCGSLLVAIPAAPSHAAGCLFESLGEGHVAEIIDGRSFRLTDGREVRLAGIEAAAPAADKASRTAALSAILADRDVTLRGADDAPDRYGRQTAFVFLESSDTLVQSLLLSEGAALDTADVADKECAAVLRAAEAEARGAKKGIWADPTVIKNAEITGDILAAVGRFTVVEGKVLSVHQAGATIYLNFGRNWTRDFAVTISRRMMPAIESAGIMLKSLENRRIRVRGWVEARTGPRIEVSRAGQIEVLGGSSLAKRT
jgi:endonuclease YncB( thermonuclease family)